MKTGKSQTHCKIPLNVSTLGHLLSVFEKPIKKMNNIIVILLFYCLKLLGSN